MKVLTAAQMREVDRRTIAMGIPGAVREDTVFTAEQTTLVDMQEVGRYALQPFWADGHQTGFYPFTLLRSLCPCPACRAAATTTSTT